MKITFVSARDNSLIWGDVVDEGGDTSDRVHIYSDGRVEICERVANAAGTISIEGEPYEILHTLLEIPTIEHTLDRFYGGRICIFEWDKVGLS